MTVKSRPPVRWRVFLSLVVATERKKRGDDAKLPATAPESMKTNEKYALLVGVSDYIYYDAPLNYPANDVEAIRTELENIGFPPENIRVLRSGGRREDTPL